MKIAVITDTNSGMTIEEGKQYGVSILPMPFIVEDQIYAEGVDFNREGFYQMMLEDRAISTSQPAPETVTGLWDQLLEEYDEIIHIPMSSGLSGSCQTAMMLAQDYGGRVKVVNNQRISVTQKQSALDAAALVRQGKTAGEIKDILETAKFDSTIYIMVDTLKYLKKGGRITAAAAALGTLLKIKPVLTIQGEKLDAFAKARTLKQAKVIMTTAIQKDLTERFKDSQARECYLYIVHANAEQAAEELREELQERYPETGKIEVAPISLSVTCHTGPGALAVACVKKLVKDEAVE